MAEYEVNKANVARNVVKMTIRPDVVDMRRCVPCWHIAPRMNVEISSDDHDFPPMGCNSWISIMRKITSRAAIAENQTSMPKGRRNIFATEDNGG